MTASREASPSAGTGWMDPTIANVLYYGNFVAPFVDAIRDPLFFGELPSLGNVVYAFGVSAGFLAFAAFVFRRIDDQLAAQL
jgi:ABC-type polysaccharide/polyol phosphate export permease